MALEKSRFFDSVGDDRVYQADHFAEYFRLFLTNGILNGGTNLQVTADGNSLSVKCDYGKAMIEGYAYWLEDNQAGLQVMQVEAADTVVRIDRVVLCLDRSLATRAISLRVRKGVPAANPIPPALIRTNNVYELSLAQIKVRGNALTISSADITDERLDQTVCGLINSLISLDTAHFQAQADAFFETIINQGYLPVTGGDMIGPIGMGGNKLNGLPEPTEQSDAATKQFVDSSTTAAKTYAVELDTVLKTYTDTQDTAIKTDLRSNAIGKGASQIGVLDASNIFTSTTVEGALCEVKKLADDNKTNVSLLARECGVKQASTGAGVSSFDDYLNYPSGYNINNCNVFITSMGTPYGYAVLPYAVLKESSKVRVRFVVRDGSIITASQEFPYAYLFVRMP